MGLRWGMMATLLIEIAYVGPQVRPFTFSIYKKKGGKIHPTCDVNGSVKGQENLTCI